MSMARGSHLYPDWSADDDGGSVPVLDDGVGDGALFDTLRIASKLPFLSIHPLREELTGQRQPTADNGGLPEPGPEPKPEPVPEPGVRA
jgi:hypothetical protein